MFRVRMKTWTDIETGEQYIAAAGALISKDDQLYMRVAAMSDTRLKHINMSLAQWNELPFCFFKEDGPVKDIDKPNRLFDRV